MDLITRKIHIGFWQETKDDAAKEKAQPSVRSRKLGCSNALLTRLLTKLCPVLLFASLVLCAASASNRFYTATSTANPIWTAEQKLIIQYNVKGVITFGFIFFAAAAWLKHRAVQNVCTALTMLTAAQILPCALAGSVSHYLVYQTLLPFEVVVALIITFLLLAALFHLLYLCLHLSLHLYSVVDRSFSTCLQLYSNAIAKLAAALFSIHSCLLLVVLLPLLNSYMPAAAHVDIDASSAIIQQGAALPSTPLLQKFRLFPTASLLFLTSHFAAVTLADSATASPLHLLEEHDLTALHSSGSARKSSLCMLN